MGSCLISSQMGSPFQAQRRPFSKKWFLCWWEIKTFDSKGFCLPRRSDEHCWPSDWQALMPGLSGSLQSWNVDLFSNDGEPFRNIIRNSGGIEKPNVDLQIKRRAGELEKVSCWTMSNGRLGPFKLGNANQADRTLTTSKIRACPTANWSFQVIHSN